MLLNKNAKFNEMYLNSPADYADSRSFFCDICANQRNLRETLRNLREILRKSA
jgi:hypothetical protein